MIIVDPGDAAPVLNFLDNHALELMGILITHKHADHTGGIDALLEKYPNTPVYAHALENVATATHQVKDNEKILINEWNVCFTVIHIPGHTLGHVAYYADPLLFTGDTLFGAGCGRVFEGTAAQMYTSLNKLAALLDDTLVYCGHEYTLANLHFAATVEKQNINIQQRIAQTEKLLMNNQPSLPSTLKLEKETNPFLRCKNTTVITSVEEYVSRKLTDEIEVFSALRKWKNNF